MTPPSRPSEHAHGCRVWKCRPDVPEPCTCALIERQQVFDLEAELLSARHRWIAAGERVAALRIKLRAAHHARDQLDHPLIVQVSDEPRQHRVPTEEEVTEWKRKADGRIADLTRRIEAELRGESPGPPTDGLPDRSAIRDYLAALAQRCSDWLPRPDGIIGVVILTDETGAYVGVGANCESEYRDRMIQCAAHGDDRVDHFEVKEPRSAGGLHDA